jgi:hypothetical protein
MTGATDPKETIPSDPPGIVGVDRTVGPRVGLYLCKRTSDSVGKPCVESFRVPLLCIDTRSCDDPKKIPENRGTVGDWYVRGTNHRVEGGKIRRDMGIEEVWAVELADVQAFVDKYGACVVRRNADGFCTIEIYDDSRE